MCIEDNEIGFAIISIGFPKLSEEALDKMPEKYKDMPKNINKNQQITIFNHSINSKLFCSNIKLDYFRNLVNLDDDKQKCFSKIEQEVADNRWNVNWHVKTLLLHEIFQDKK